MTGDREEWKKRTYCPDLAFMEKGQVDLETVYVFIIRLTQ